MHVVCVAVHVKQDQLAPFVQAILENARGTRQEPGNARFDVLQHAEDPTRFLLYEAYHSPADFTAHQQTPHYLKFKALAADWMAEPRVGVKYRSLFPADADF
jgi:(4S)-4-hydroxy-5-phosphonooxypentane-2,3-dione isomerase